MSLRDECVEAMAQALVDRHWDHHISEIRQENADEYRREAADVLDAVLDVLEAHADEWWIQGSSAAYDAGDLDLIVGLIVALRDSVGVEENQ